MSLLRRIRTFIRPARMERDLDDELAFHLAMRTQELIRQGVPEAEARRETALRFGGRSLAHEEARSRNIVPWLESVFQDLRYAWRQLAAHRGFTAVAVGTLAIAIGANATIFTLLNAIYLRTLDVPEPERLVQIHRTDPGNSVREQPLAAAEYQLLREQATVFAGLTTQNWNWIWFSDGERSQEWQGGQVPANYFHVLGVRPRIGRFFDTSDDGALVVLSHAVWQRTFDGDTDVIGRTVRLNQQPHVVVGVAPEGFRGFRESDAFGAWILAKPDEGAVSGRLRPGVSLDQARAQLATLAPRLEEMIDANRRGSTISLRKLRGVSYEGQQDISRVARLLVATVMCLLLIACANLAGLLLARSDARKAEMALRLSLGASRFRLLRQLLTESVTLSVLGAAAGFALAIYGCRAIEPYLGYRIPELRLEPDWTIAAACGVLALLTAILFGLAPATQTIRSSLTAALRRNRVAGTAAVTGQIALTTVLLVCAGLALESVRNLVVRPGFDPERILHFRLRPSRNHYSLDRSRNYNRELLRRIERIPGVEKAVLGRTPPSGAWCCDIAVARPGEPEVQVNQNEVIPGFLDTMGMPVIRGRDFNEADRDVAIVNQALADRLWPGGALNQEIRIEGRPHRVIGVTPSAYPSKAGAPPMPYLFLPGWSRNVADMRLFVRVSGNGAAMLEQVRREVVAVDPEVHVGQESTLAARIGMSYQHEYLMAATFEFAGVVALLLSGIGVYGLVAYQVSRRRREIGLRMALGARAGEVAGWMMRRGMSAAAAGLGIGLLASWQSAKGLSAFLYGVQPADIASFAGGAVVLCCAALAASYFPARSAARIEPAIALRQD